MLDDPYYKVIQEHWADIVMAYDSFRDKKPILEYELPRHRIVNAFIMPLLATLLISREKAVAGFPNIPHSASACRFV